MLVFCGKNDALEEFRISYKYKYLNRHIEKHGTKADSITNLVCTERRRETREMKRRQAF